MTRKFKNPYHQSQSELAEWLALFAQDYSTTEVADALVERYPERSTGDAKADHRFAKEAICTVNPNDNRYNAGKWAKQYGLMQANYAKEREKSMRHLESKSVTALNAAFDNLESTISSLSPKEQISLVPKALLTLNQAVKNVKPPLPTVTQDNHDEDTPTEAQLVESQSPESESRSVEDLLQVIHKTADEVKAHGMLRNGKSYDEITAKTGVTEDELKEWILRKRVEHEVLGMYKNGVDTAEIHRRTKLDYGYIDSIIEDAVLRRICGEYVSNSSDREFHDNTRALLRTGEDFDVESDGDRSLN
ncbi:MAG: hypothetical protein OXP71_00895 [Candidatus Poribacteria bacterium]|nr:hypothetical protein [Candidatus Poribacteria bacterium]